MTYARNLFFLLLTYSSLSLHAQTEDIQITFNSKRINDSIDKIFDMYPIDRIRVFFKENAITSIRLYELDSIRPSSHLGKEVASYSWHFEGDQYLLKREFPALFSFFNDKYNIKTIQKKVRKDSFQLFVTKTGFTYRKLLVGDGYPNAYTKQDRLKELIATLNMSYDNSIVATGDSVLIFQGVVNKDGTLVGEMELTYGKKDALHDYFLRTYAYYVNHVLAKKTYKPAMFVPHNQNGYRRSLMDFYVRLNADKTFTISTTGVGRKLKLKNYQNDPKNPLFY